MILVSESAVAWLNSEERKGSHYISKREWSQSHREVEAIQEEKDKWLEFVIDICLWAEGVKIFWANAWRSELENLCSVYVQGLEKLY